MFLNARICCYLKYTTSPNAHTVTHKHTHSHINKQTSSANICTGVIKIIKLHNFLRITPTFVSVGSDAEQQNDNTKINFRMTEKGAMLEI